MDTKRAVTAVCVAASVALAGCGEETRSSTSVTSTEPTSAVVTSSVSTTVEPVVTVSTSGPPATTAPPTTSPPTTIPPATSPPTTVPPATAPPTTAPSAGPATAFVAADDRLVEVDVASGAVARVIADFFSGDGVFRGGLRASSDRSSIWFSEGYEDGWFGCESSVGQVGRVDVASGAIELVAAGSGVEPSPDGTSIAFLDSDVCVPDPEAPEFWVLTPYDRVVLRDLGSGEEVTFTSSDTPDGYGAPGAVEDVTFTPDGRLLVLMGDGRLFNVDPAGPKVIQEHPVLLPEVTGIPLVAFGDALLTVEFGAEGSTDVYLVDPRSGDATRLASAESFMAVGSDPELSLVAAAPDGISDPDGYLTVLEIEGDSFVFDIDW